MTPDVGDVLKQRYERDIKLTEKKVEKEKSPPLRKRSGKSTLTTTYDDGPVFLVVLDGFDNV